MDASDSPPQPAPQVSSKPLTAPLALWLIVQLLALALAAARVPLSAHFVQPGEVLAVQEMLVVQFALSSMGFPLLFRDARSCLAMILTSAPMLQLAGVLAEISIARLVGVWTCLAVWLASLAIWNGALGASRRSVAVAIASLLTIGGLVFWYLSTEFHHGSYIVRALPLVATMRFAAGIERFALPLCSTAFVMLFALAATLLTRRCAPRCD